LDLLTGLLGSELAESGEVEPIDQLGMNTDLQIPELLALRVDLLALRSLRPEARTLGVGPRGCAVR
jgi:hypothetical protein